jgi:hypothetical protein
MKNIFYQRIDGDWLEALNLLNKRYNFDSIFTIIGESMFKKDSNNLVELLKKNPELNSKIKEKFNIADLYLSNLKKYVYEKKTIPLDDNLLSSMAYYEKTILKMFERNDYKSFEFEQRIVNYHNQLSFWNTFILNEKIDAVFFVVYPHAVHNYILYALCKIKKIPVYFFALTSIPSYFLPSSDIENLSPTFNKRFQDNLVKYENSSIYDIELCEDFKKVFEDHSSDKVPVPYYMNKNYFKKYSKINIRLLFDKLKKGSFTDIIRSINRRLLHKLKTKSILKIYNKFSNKIELNEKFIYFPLHYQPEGTTCPMGGHFVWQILAIKMLSYHIPDKALIYVKEHPSIVHFEVGRDVRLYKELKEINNVRLVPFNIESSELVKNSIAVATITGTAAFEAVFKGKKSIIFGNHINAHAPNIFSVKNNQDCKKTIQIIFQEKNKQNVTLLKDLKVYLKTLEETSYKIRKIDKNDLNKDIINNIVKGYESLID